MEKYLTVKETLDALKISRATLYRMIDRDELAVSRVGRLLRFKEADVLACFKGKEGRGD